MNSLPLKVIQKKNQGYLAIARAQIFFFRHHFQL
jgi:hypothetical protein